MTMQYLIKINITSAPDIIKVKQDIIDWLNEDAAPRHIRGIINMPNGVSWSGRYCFIDFFDDSTATAFKLHFGGDVNILQ